MTTSQRLALVAVKAVLLLTSHLIFTPIFRVGQNKYSRFLLFVGAVFYQVATDTKLADTEPLFLKEILAQIPVSLWSHHFHLPIII